MTIRVLSVLHDTTVDGPGFRTSIYCAGCGHHCPGCHNPQSWDFDGGEERSVDDLMAEITEDPFADVTFTGGDPLYATTTIVHQIYQRGFTEFKMGYASAMAVVLLVIISLLTALSWRLNRGGEA